MVQTIAEGQNGFQVTFSSRAGDCKLLGHNCMTGEIGLEYEDACGKNVLVLPHEVAKKLGFFILSTVLENIGMSTLRPLIEDLKRELDGSNLIGNQPMIRHVSKCHRVMERLAELNGRLNVVNQELSEKLNREIEQGDFWRREAEALGARTR